MPTPILIAARNEAAYIGQTLDSLPRDGVEPIVIPNGCSDSTTRIAESFGATVLNCPMEGKMLALQAGIRYLGREAVEPFITLDADTYPAFPSTWLADFLEARKALPADQPATLTGALRYSGGGTPWIRNAAFQVRQYRHRHDDYGGAFPGANSLIHPVTPDTVEALLELENFWPGEDRAIKDELLKHGGYTLKLWGKMALAITDGSRLPRVMLTRMGRRNSRQRTVATYIAEAPQDSIPYRGSAREQARKIPQRA